jgi:riboflavin synthase
MADVKFPGFDMNNFVIDRIIRGVALSQKDDSVLFSINQIQNASLNCASESTDAVDAMGTPIATFYRAKSAEFSAENALFDMNLMATQLGTEKKVAGVNVPKITVPAMESFTAEGGKYVLKHTPKVVPSEIYALGQDSTFARKYAKETSASENAFAYSEADNAITLPTSVADGAEMFVMYEYDTENAVEVVNSAKNFPVGCKFIMEVLGCDVCDQTNLVYAYVIFNNAKLSPDFDWSIATDGTHPFSMKAQQDYCDKEKRLFSIVIPGEDKLIDM